MSRPTGGAASFAEISKRTGIPRSTVYDIYRRVEMKFVLAYVIQFRWQQGAGKKLAAA